MATKPAEIRIVHGDESAKRAFKQCLVELNYPSVLIPDQ
ncbi:MBL fold metallo-hydrolase RNA specificity domain-containing protein [Marinobacter sp. LV10R510-11A]|nr:MBL fold metallo-hydrolase RNA specificity domain-containing protein [Marinobacter sp. LV10R510-11A]